MIAKTKIIKKVSVIICDKCVNYRKIQTTHMEVFYHCSFDEPRTVRNCIDNVKRSTPSIDAVLLKGKCVKFAIKKHL